MDFKEGQAFLGKIKFVDGSVPEYERPYLIIYVDEVNVGVLNISSIKGKERKLAFPYNKRIYHYNPPFLKPSFVKLDSYTLISKCECSKFQLLSSGKTLNTRELEEIKNQMLW